MRKFDVIVIGSGSGMIIAGEAASHGLKVALVDKGPYGGTCLNNGCIPSKMLIYAADRAVEAQEAAKLGIHAEIKSIDFKSIMERMRRTVGESRDGMRRSMKRSRNPHFYEGEGHFTGEYEMEINGETIRADKIYIASGSRPFIPPIKGLDSVEYLTNVTLLELSERPESLLVIGGGYIGVEYAHFFAGMGTKVTIVEMADRLVLAEEPEISRLLQKRLSRRLNIYTRTRIEEVRSGGKGVIMAISTDGDATEKKELTAEKLLVAAGRVSNADILKVEKTGVETDKRGYIKVDASMETTKKNIFAVGDANGQHMFTHVANREALIAAENLVHEAGLKMSYAAVPHAVYSHPQIAAVGLTQKEAREKHDILVGIASYRDVAKGDAMIEDEAFAKAIVDRDEGRILGFHIIGPYSPELIQEVTNAMAAGGKMDWTTSGMHIHPALSELIPATLNRLEEAS